MLRLRNRLARSFLLGLFPVSFVFGAGGSSFELEELEEERRLFYVAVTRAEKKVQTACTSVVPYIGYNIM